MVRLVFCLWLAASGFTLSQRQATSKVSIDIFVRFPLASSAGRSVHTTSSLARQPPRFAEKWFTGLPTRSGLVKVVVGRAVPVGFCGFVEVCVVGRRREFRGSEGAAFG